MHRRILVIPAGQREPVTAVCLGLVQALSEMRIDVGYAKPIAQDYGSVVVDQSIEVFRMVTRLRPPQSTPAETAIRELASGGMELAMAGIVHDSRDVQQHELVVFEGLAPIRESVVTSQLNRELAVSLDADVLLVASVAGNGLENLVEQVQIAARPYQSLQGKRILGVVVEGFEAGQEDLLDEVRDRLAEAEIPVVAAVRHDPELSRIRAGDLVHQLRLDVLSVGDLDRRIESTLVAAQAPPALLHRLRPGQLVVVPGDRADVVMAAALAELGGQRPAALLLTRGVRPDAEVLELCAPALDAGLPVLLTDGDTYDTAIRIDSLDTQIPADDEARGERVMRVYASAFETTWLRRVLDGDRPQFVPYARLRAGVVEKLGSRRWTVALPGPFTGDVLAAVALFGELEAVECRLVGPRQEIVEAVEAARMPMLKASQIVDTAAPQPHVVQVLAEKRGVSPEEASAALADPVTHALALAAAGEVDGVMAGEISREGGVMRLADEIVGRRPADQPLSSFSVLLHPESIVFFADTVFAAEPDASALALVAENAADRALGLGVHPTVRFVLAPGTPGDHPHAAKLRAAAEELELRRPDLDVVAPVPFDEAVGGPVQSGTRLGGGFLGHASVFVFPDSEQARRGLEAEQRRTHAEVLGPIPMGLARQVTGRPASGATQHLVDVIGITAVLGGRD